MMIVQKRQNHVELNGIFPPGLYMFQQVTWDSIVHPRAISTTVALNSLQILCAIPNSNPDTRFINWIRFSRFGKLYLLLVESQGLYYCKSRFR